MKPKIILELIGITIFILLFDLLVNNYLFFHVIAELFSISILFVLFAITWNARKYITNRYLLFVGIAALFVGVLDLLHMLTYKGMNIISSPIFFANQFWIATRFFESTVLLSGFLFVANKYTIRVRYLIIIYTTVTTGIILSILYFRNFPVCFIENVGQTPFKIYSEYVIIAILFAALFVLFQKKRYFEKETFGMLVWSIILTIITEFCFTLYVRNYDYINQIGHVFKILAFYMIYKANIQNGLKQPIETFFRELKVSEEKIKEYNKELEKEIATKNRFFSIIAHDLKNPFTVLSGFTEFLLANYDKFNDDARKKNLKVIHDTSESTYRLLENLLAWSRAQMGTLSYHPLKFDIKDVLDDSLVLASRQAKVKGILIEKNYDSEYVWADVDMIKTIIRNFLSNAIKFTHKSGKVVVRFNTEGKFLRICVDDSGVGIPEIKLKDLFRIDINHSTKGTEQETGTGIGLILCREFVKMNGGEIFAESEENKGSTFCFTLPLAKFHESNTE